MTHSIKTQGHGEQSRTTKSFDLIIVGGGATAFAAAT